MIDVPFTDATFLDDIATNILVVDRGGGLASETMVLIANGYKASGRERLPLPRVMFASLLGVIGALGNDPDIGARLAAHVQEFWDRENARLTAESN